MSIYFFFLPFTKRGLAGVGVGDDAHGTLTVADHVQGLVSAVS